MSYCRFSSDNWTSDLYVYESERGYEIITAGRRLMVPPPAVDLAILLTDTPEASDEYLRQHRAQMAFLETAELVGTDHPDAGKSFLCDTPAEAADLLIRLRAEGFHVPSGVIEALREEQETDG